MLFVEKIYPEIRKLAEKQRKNSMINPGARCHDFELSAATMWNWNFHEEAREFIEKANPNRKVLIISHTDGRGKGVFPIINTPGATGGTSGG